MNKVQQILAMAAGMGINIEQFSQTLSTKRDSKYMPHQGKKECARRVKQANK